MHGFHHDGGPRGHGLPPMFAMAGRMPGFAAAAGGRARRGDIRRRSCGCWQSSPYGYQIIRNPPAVAASGTQCGFDLSDAAAACRRGSGRLRGVGGQKVYHLTDAGRAAVDDLGAESAPWEEAAAAFPGGDFIGCGPTAASRLPDWQGRVTGPMGGGVRGDGSGPQAVVQDPRRGLIPTVTLSNVRRRLP